MEGRGRIPDWVGGQLICEIGSMKLGISLCILLKALFGD
jgi:hypothetical protein